MIKYTQTQRIQPCRLTKEDLFNLVDLIQTDFPKSERKEDFQIIAFIPGADASENSLNDLFTHKNLPKFLDKLSIRQIGWSTEGNIDKSLDLTFYNSFIELRISGELESWVRGKKLQVTDFLKAKRPFLWFIHTVPILILRGSFFPLILAGVGIMGTQIYKNGIDSVGIILPISVLCITLFDFAIGKYPYVRIYIEKEKTFIERYNTLIIVITFVAAIFTIIGVIFQISKVL